ncbi:MAG: PEP-utilizing enzyme [Desulfobaccales bacterium]
MSWWQRLFKRDRSAQATRRPLSLREQYQRKVQLYAELVAATDAALEILAQMQVRLHAPEYFSPAYLHLNSALALDLTRRVLTSLQRFTHQENADLAEALAWVEAKLQEEFQAAAKSETNRLLFERVHLTAAELLASGWAYPAEEANAPEALIVKAVWGWWPAVQEGMVRARRFQVLRGQVKEFPSPDTGTQEHWLTYQPEQGFVKEPLPSRFQGQPCLKAEEALQIAQYFALLASLYPDLSEVEWGLGPQREVFILRGLRQPSLSPPDSPGDREAEVLFSQGLTIYPGVATGPALRLDADRVPPRSAVPAGTVLFTNKPALSLAPLLDNLAALVVETGDSQNHLAFLVRERRLPAIFALRGDTSRLPSGAPVTVDARRLRISRASCQTPVEASGPEEGPAFLALSLLKRLSPWLFSLHLAPTGTPPALTACQSLHELLYQAAARRRQEMFCLSLRSEVGRKDAVNLVTGRMVPILVIDGGGGLTAEGPSATFEEVSSLPFRAFLGGMMSIPWPKGRPLDVKGFISVIGVTSTTPHAEDQLRRVSFALLSDKYMNFSLCLGYHASTIEAYVGANLDHNYIRFHYQGGAASLERRLRRLQLIGEVLTHLGFTVTVQGDLLDGLAVGDPESSLLKKLEILGRLEVYTKQMDMLMADDTVVSGHVAEFLEKHGEAHQSIS